MYIHVNHKKQIDVLFFSSILNPMKTDKLIQVRNTDHWVDKLDAWRLAQPVKPSRSEAIRTAVEAFIDQNGNTEGARMKSALAR